MTLLPSQILILATIALFLLYTFRLRTLLLERVMLVLIVAVGVVLALDPDLSTRVANRVGIGRGADLLLYLFLLFSLFAYVHIAARLRAIDRRITRIVQDAAVERAEKGADAQPLDEE